MAVTVEYVMKEDVIDVNDVLGGIRICVDGTSINRATDTITDDSYEWRLQYAGRYLHTELSRLMRLTRYIAEGKVGVYQTVKMPFPPGKELFLFEPLSRETIRIAYRIKQSSNIPDSFPPLATPESACGYVVDRCEFCRAVNDAAHEYVADLRSMPLEWGFDLLEEFEEKLADFDEAVETCAEMPPELDQEKQSPIEPPWES